MSKKVKKPTFLQELVALNSQLEKVMSIGVPASSPMYPQLIMVCKDNKQYVNY